MENFADISQAEKVYAVDGINQGLRNDGRELMDFRPIVVEFDVMPNTHGSARVRLGQTDLIAAIKLKMRQVTDTEDFSNRIDFYVTCSAVASTDFAGKHGDDCAQRIASLLRKAYRNDFILPELKKFKLSKDRYYQTKVDILILQYDGNAVDAASVAAKAALSDLKYIIPTMIARDKGKTVPQLPGKARSQIQTLDISNVPMIVTLNSFGDNIFLDATLEEEQCVGGVLHVGVIPLKEENYMNEIEMKEQAENCFITLLKNTKPNIFHEEKFDQVLSTGIEAAIELNRVLQNRIEEYKREPKKNAEERIESFMGDLQF
uniref:Exoribonuclease phosphorolytic domain-containing protein n=1 Tax=Panagrolaimus sp. PS1159 TaxID=55785 RepID=A0AC35F6J3_9BILA